MNVGPLASLDDESISEVVQKAAKSLSVDHEFDRDDLDFVARMAVAATGGHIAVSDSFFFECQRSAALIEPRKRSKWKHKCDDARGTRRNIIIGNDGMLRVRDDGGRHAPLVPASISKTVNGVDDFSTWVSENMPRFLYDRIVEARISEPAPLPKITADRRSRTATKP
jgi:hypothetical protein